MGKIASKLKSTNNENDEQEIIKYEESLDHNAYGYGLQDTADLRKIKWWQRLIFDLRFRIVYALIIAVLIGIVVPIVVRAIFYETNDSTIYGSCLIKEDSRFQCLINNREVNRQQCVEANCCWEENEELSYKCFHSFPSAYQYHVTNIKEVSGNGTTPGDWIELSVSPNHEEKMNPLTVWIRWMGENHLNLQIFNPSHYPERQMSGTSLNDKQNQRLMDRSGIMINYGNQDNYFFIQIERNDSGVDETIFDTRLGPINSGSNFMAFSTTLPTPYFYGLSGGEGIASKGTLTYGVMNGYKNAEFPFYMALEDSNLWHGVLLETSLPFMTQVLQAPGIAFHLEGSKAEVNLQFFIGPEKTDVLQQLHYYLVDKLSVESEAPELPYIPPYWGLGLHLCRQLPNASMVLKDIYDLNEIIDEKTGQRKVPYDSDCIDENFRIPFEIDIEKFPTEFIENSTNFLLNDAMKKIVFSQKVALPWSEETDIKEIEEFLLMDRTNMSNIRPFFGMIDNLTCVYLDVFHPNIFKNLSLWGFDFGDIPVSGLILTDNYPRNEAISECNLKPDTFLQKLLQASNISSVNITDSDINPWGSICPDIKHTLDLGENGESINEKTHLELHNTYGLKTMKLFREIAIAEVGLENKGNFLMSGQSLWTESLYFGAQNGMEVDFSWISLRESLAHIIRHFILAPVSGIPVCGSFLPEETTVFDMNLCLRSYQLALLLPQVYHNYAHGNFSRGPLDFSQRYQTYLREAVRQRYSYAPYYYTLLKEYQTTLIPMITPVSFHFFNTQGVDRDVVFKLLDEFMIGEAILAAPIVKPELNRDTYFPPGVWYDSDGYVACNNLTGGCYKIVTGHLTQTPLFLRGGYIIPILEDPLGNSILESRAKEAHYTLLVAILPNSGSFGMLSADVDVGLNETLAHKIYFEVTTSFENSEIQVNTTISATDNFDLCTNFEYTSHINQIKYLGFPNNFKNVTISYEERPEATLSLVWGDDLDYLRIQNISMNWCEMEYAHINIVAYPTE